MRSRRWWGGNAVGREIPPYPPFGAGVLSLTGEVLGLAGLFSVAHACSDLALCVWVEYLVSA